jgi:MFS superfamily sulfate permease-like transporter
LLIGLALLLATLPGLVFLTLLAGLIAVLPGLSRLSTLLAVPFHIICHD